MAAPERRRDQSAGATLTSDLARAIGFCNAAMLGDRTGQKATADEQ